MFAHVFAYGVNFFPRDVSAIDRAVRPVGLDVLGGLFVDK